MEKQRDKALSQALNLLASKEPMAYQMIQAVQPQFESASEYNGHYVTAEEYESMLAYDKKLTDLFGEVEGTNGD